jgi:hypothetical protein
MADRRHIEFFGPDLARGPVLAGSPQTAAVQLATALAQLRAPLSRADDEIRAHADFIRELADRLFPDWAVSIAMDVEPLSGGAIPTTFRLANGVFNLLECWLADNASGGPTTAAPDSVTWNIGVVVHEFVANKHWLILTPDTAIAKATVNFAGSRDWYWAATRFGRVYYSSRLEF